jgi:hypothetical protein
MPGWPSAHLVLAIFATLLLGAGAVFAADDGVHVDPDSPAGKEYALPLETARSDAGGGDGSDSGGTGKAPIFGAGISTRGGASGQGGRGGSQDSQPGDTSGGSANQQGASGTGMSPSQTGSVAASSGGGLPAGVLTLLVALGVLAVGGIIGLSVRILRRTDPAS